MRPDAEWRSIAEQRRSLADLLDGLPAAAWETPSLCVGWRVRDVAAHVALAPQYPGWPAMSGQYLRARGSFHRLDHDAAVRHAARPTEQIVAELRTYAESHRLPPVTNSANVVMDVLVHGQDIAVPLGIPRAMPTDAALAGAIRVWSMGWPFWARHRLRGFRLTATDAEWSVGSGAEVRGPVAALLLLATGRTAVALDRLAGPGVPALEDRLGTRAH